MKVHDHKSQTHSRHRKKKGETLTTTKRNSEYARHDYVGKPEQYQGIPQADRGQKAIYLRLALRIPG